MKPSKNIPLMPKATAVWLIDNTKLTFKQIAKFCNMHEIEVKGIADGDVATGILGFDPVSNGQLTKEEIERCSKDQNAEIQLKSSIGYDLINKKKKQTKYTPIARRQDKPDAIYWLVKNYPTLPINTIVKLVGTTKSTIEAIKERSHWNIKNIRPRDPVLLGICTQVELNKLVERLKLDKEDEKIDNPIEDNDKQILN